MLQLIVRYLLTVFCSSISFLSSAQTTLPLHLTYVNVQFFFSSSPLIFLFLFTRTSQTFLLLTLLSMMTCATYQVLRIVLKLLLLLLVAAFYTGFSLYLYIRSDVRFKLEWVSISMTSFDSQTQIWRYFVEFVYFWYVKYNKQM